MPCNYPMPAWKTHAGTVVLGKDPGDFKQSLALPCGGCLACRKAKAQAWTLRCLLESQEHRNTTFTTLTYSDNYLPETLQRRDLQLFIKRLRRRKSAKLRFFACGEYGETTHRPHYHALLFGISATQDAGRIQMAWHQGFTTSEPVTPQRIAYCAGYVQKKYGEAKPLPQELINYETGEVFTWQEPFIQMSRRPGIGGNARRHTASWRDFAILNGTKIPVPEYLHKAWEETASDNQIEEREHEQYLRKLTKERITTRQLEAQEMIARSQQQLHAAKRKY